VAEDSGGGGDLYDSSMGEGVTGGSVRLDGDGPGKDHVNVHGDGAHFSWTVNRDKGGDASDVHGELHRPNRPW